MRQFVFSEYHLKSVILPLTIEGGEKITAAESRFLLITASCRNVTQGFMLAFIGRVFTQ